MCISKVGMLNIAIIIVAPSTLFNHKWMHFFFISKLFTFFREQQLLLQMKYHFVTLIDVVLFDSLHMLGGAAGVVPCRWVWAGKSIVYFPERIEIQVSWLELQIRNISRNNKSCIVFPSLFRFWQLRLWCLHCMAGVHHQCICIHHVHVVLEEEEGIESTNRRHGHGRRTHQYWTIEIPQQRKSSF